MTFRVFERTWWRDSACTVPGAGRKRYDPRTFKTAEEARAVCQAENARRPGHYRRQKDAAGNMVRTFIPNRGPLGRASEFEES